MLCCVFSAFGLFIFLLCNFFGYRVSGFGCVLAVDDEIREVFLSPARAGFDRGYQLFRRQVFRRQKWNGFCIT